MSLKKRYNKYKDYYYPSDHFAERDWRDRQKVLDGLKDTVDKQNRDLDSVRKEIMEKEMLCCTLRVSCLVSLV